MEPKRTRIAILSMVVLAAAFAATPRSYGGVPLDCNGNGVDDATDIATGTSQDCNANGVPDECDIGALNFHIPVNPPITVAAGLPPAVHTFNISAGGTVSDVDMGITLAHTWVSDVVIQVEHLGTTVVVFASQCGGEDDFSGTIWDDEAAGPIVCTPGHVGSFTPFSPLSAFDGLPVAGDWTVTVTDNVGGDDGSLTQWSLRFTISGATSLDCNINGIPDECDISSGSSLDCDANSVPDECDIGALDIDIPVNPPIVVSDALPPAVDTVNILAGGNVADVNLDLTMTHTFVNDLVIQIEHLGTTVVVFNRQCSSDRDFSGTIWDDEAAGPILCSDGHVGTFTPDSPLSAFDGLPVAGAWTLTVDDNGAGDDGSLTGWSLHITSDTGGTSNDCNLNGIPDDCDLAGGASFDCNSNGILDECDVRSGASSDVNSNGILDDCETDCNANGVPDEFELSSGSSMDCNTNGVPDGCDIGGLNFNIPVNPPIAVSDALPAVHTVNISAGGNITDVNLDLTLTHTFVNDLVIQVEHLGTTVVVFNSQCGSEHNFLGTIWDDEASGPIVCTAGHVGTFTPFSPLSAFDGLPVAGDWTLTIVDTFAADDGSLTGWSLHITRDSGETSTDCNANGIPDECEADCNANGIVDECDISGGMSDDCNANGIPDDCETDCNANGVPDDCEGADITASGSFIGLVYELVPPGPQGGGNHDPEVMRDGVFPPLGSNNDAEQFDTFHFGDQAVGGVDWIGYTFAGARNFSRVTFQEGKQFSNGGWFGTLTVQVRSGGVWSDVSGLTITPAYAGGNGVNFETYEMRFQAVAGDAIRIHGTLGGFATFISVGELRVFEALPDCNANGVPDECDIAGGTSFDCNTNGTPDDCELAGNDCDVNLVPDDCDPDADSDGVPDGCDVCVGDDATGDSDADGVCDSADVCPGGDDIVDTDGDGAPDFCDACPADNPDDSDGDGVCDSSDVCPGGDDNVDTDGDSVADFCDACPNDSPDDTDGDGICDSADACPGGDDNVDTDVDGTPDFCDACPVDNPNDSDGDGVCESMDICPGGDDTVDSDSDSVPDACDACAGGAGTGDTDANGSVDLVDFDDLAPCVGGPGGGLGTGCECFDFDFDGDNDLIDFAAFTQNFGP